MPTQKKKTQQKPAILSPQLLYTLGALFIVGGFVFFAPYMGLICISALLAYMLLPLYKLFDKKMPSFLAVWSVIAVAILAIIVPVVLIGITLIKQTIQVIAALSEIAETDGSRLNVAVEQLTGYLEKMGLSSEQASQVQNSINEFVSGVVPSMLSLFVNSILGIAASLPVLLTSLTIAAFLFSAILRKHKEVGRFLLDISPFDEKVTETYLNRSSLVIIASLRGQLILSFISAFMCSLLLLPLGFGPYFWFMLALLTLLGMIPIGSGIVMLPIGAITMIAVDFWLGFWFLAIYLVGICNFETIVRPKFIPKDIDIVPALAVLSVFCGVYYFGMIGVVYGPVILILITTTANVLIDQKKLRSSKV